MKIYRFIACLSIGLFTFVLIASVAHSAEVLLSMPEPPEGFVVSKIPLETDGKVLGCHVQVVNQEAFGKVVIQIELGYDRSSRPARVAALKSYVNGLANGFKDAGFKLISNTVPDLEKADFDKPQTVEMQFDNAEKGPILVRQFVFFTDKGYNVQVLASDEEELDRLSDWAKHIKPASPLDH